MATAMGLVLLALLHVYWGLGGRWPGCDRAALAELVAGTRDMPSAIACHGVASMLSFGALLVLAATDVLTLPLPRSAVALGAWALVAALAFRGIGGFFEARWRPEIRSFRYHRWSLRLYSPLCLSLATLAALELS
ncbi:MAG TPA: DUF3995 domain-containing protein [Polyangiaceae bacterium]